MMGPTELSHEEVKELIVPYVLDALPADELPMVRAHILSCDECAAEVEDYSVAASKLVLAVEPVPLPAGFADRVAAAATEGMPEPVAGKRRRFRWVEATAAVAAVLAIAVLSVSLIQTRGQLGTYKTVIAAVLGRDEGLVLTGSGGAGRVVPSDEGTVFVAAGMQEAPEGRTYELWLIADGTPVSAGTFSVDGGTVLLESDKRFDGFEGAAVTIEAEGGSPTGQPTTEPVLQG